MTLVKYAFQSQIIFVIKSLKIVQYVLILCALSLYSETVDNIKSLYSPYFPLDVVKNFVMTALDEAVQINQVHNRDPIGGSNENLFL